MSQIKLRQWSLTFQHLIPCGASRNEPVWQRENARRDGALIRQSPRAPGVFVLGRHCAPQLAVHDWSVPVRRRNGGPPVWATQFSTPRAGDMTEWQMKFCVPEIRGKAAPIKVLFCDGGSGRQPGDCNFHPSVAHPILAERFARLTENAAFQPHVIHDIPRNPAHQLPPERPEIAGAQLNT